MCWWIVYCVTFSIVKFILCVLGNTLFYNLKQIFSRCPWHYIKIIKFNTSGSIIPLHITNLILGPTIIYELVGLEQYRVDVYISNSQTNIKAKTFKIFHVMINWKTKKYHTVETVLKSNRKKSTNRIKTIPPSTYIQKPSHSWFGINITI